MKIKLFSHIVFLTTFLHQLVSTTKESGGDKPEIAVLEAGNEKPGEEKPGEEKPGEEKPEEEKPGEEGKPGEEKPGEEGKPGEEKPGEEKPGEEKPGEEGKGGGDVTQQVTSLKSGEVTEKNVAVALGSLIQKEIFFYHLGKKQMVDKPDLKDPQIIALMRVPVGLTTTFIAISTKPEMTSGKGGNGGEAGGEKPGSTKPAPGGKPGNTKPAPGGKPGSTKPAPGGGKGGNKGNNKKK